MSHATWEVVVFVFLSTLYDATTITKKHAPREMGQGFHDQRSVTKKNKPELVKALRLFFLIKLLGMKEVSLLLLVQMEIDNVTGR